MPLPQRVPFDSGHRSSDPVSTHANRPHLRLHERNGREGVVEKLEEEGCRRPGGRRGRHRRRSGSSARRRLYSRGLAAGGGWRPPPSRYREKSGHIDVALNASVSLPPWLHLFHPPVTAQTTSTNICGHVAVLPTLAVSVQDQSYPTHATHAVLPSWPPRNVPCMPQDSAPRHVNTWIRT